MEKLLCILCFRFFFFLQQPDGDFVVAEWLVSDVSADVKLSQGCWDVLLSPEQAPEWKTSHRVIVTSMHVLGILLTKPCAYKYTLLTKKTVELWLIGSGGEK